MMRPAAMVPLNVWRVLTARLWRWPAVQSYDPSPITGRTGPKPGY